MDLSRLELHYDRERWDRAQSVYGMLYWLRIKHPKTYQVLKPNIHRYLVANCERIWHLLPNKNSRLGIECAKAWLRGEMSEMELYQKNYYVEGAAFFFDYAKDEEDIEEIKTLIDGTPELLSLDFDQARNKLKDAAYLADKAMMFPFLKGATWRWWSRKDYLLDPELFRKFLPAKKVFDCVSTQID